MYDAALNVHLNMVIDVNILFKAKGPVQSALISAVNMGMTKIGNKIFIVSGLKGLDVGKWTSLTDCMRHIRKVMGKVFKL
jgi:hypothetical protein